MKQVKVTVGQDVVIRNNRKGFTFGYVVSKVSPTGLITVVKNGDKLVFNPDGFQRTSDRLYIQFLRTDVQACRDAAD